MCGGQKLACLDCKLPQERDICSLNSMLSLQVNADQQEEDEGKWAATKGMQYTSRGRKLSYSNKAIFQMMAPLLAWMALVIVDFGVSYMFLNNSTPRLDAVNSNARIQAYSKQLLSAYPSSSVKQLL